MISSIHIALQIIKQPFKIEYLWSMEYVTPTLPVPEVRVTVLAPKGLKSI